MAKFEVIGKGKDSGRNRKRIYTAASEAEAKQLAENEGTVVGEIIKLPPDPPTDKQLAYAKDLGISIPRNATKEDLTDLISLTLSKDKPSSQNHRTFAKKYGVETTKYIGKKELFDRIQYMLVTPGRETELLSWFTYRVYRELVKGDENAQITSPSDPIIRNTAEQFASDEKIIKSVRSYKGRELIWFGEWTAPDGFIHKGGSNRTMAYKQISSKLKEKLNLTPNTSTRKKSPSERAYSKDSANETQGCLTSITFAIAVPIGFYLAVMWL